MRINEYNYSDLRDIAICTGEACAIESLIAWLEQYCPWAWNGMYWDIDGGYAIYPIYNLNSDDYNIIGYEIR